MKIYGYNEPLREIALILKEITGLWYDMCTVKLGYKYTDPDSRLKKQKTTSGGGVLRKTLSVWSYTKFSVKRA